MVSTPWNSGKINLSLPQRDKGFTFHQFQMFSGLNCITSVILRYNQPNLYWRILCQRSVVKHAFYTLLKWALAPGNGATVWYGNMDWDMAMKTFTRRF